MEHSKKLTLAQDNSGHTRMKCYWLTDMWQWSEDISVCGSWANVLLVEILLKRGNSKAKRMTL